MTELEKMLAGEHYDWRDPELSSIQNRGKKLMTAYNRLEFGEWEAGLDILRDLLGSVGENIVVNAPFFIDYGKFIHIGDNTEINMNCVFLDCNRITIGRNVMIAPGVHIYTVFHPLKASERYILPPGEKVPMALGLTAPVTIGDDVWIGGNTVVLPGVTIGRGSVIGAGSVVTKSIPENVLALGNPCRVVRLIE